MCYWDAGKLCTRGLADGEYALAASSIYSGEGEDVVLGRVLKVAKDGVDASCGIWDKHNRLKGCMNKLGDGLTRAEQVLAIIAAEKGVRACFGEVLKVAERFADGNGNGAVSA